MERPAKRVRREESFAEDLEGVVAEVVGHDSSPVDPEVSSPGVHTGNFLFVLCLCGLPYFGGKCQHGKPECAAHFVRWIIRTFLTVGYSEKKAEQHITKHGGCADGFTNIAGAYTRNITFLGKTMTFYVDEQGVINFEFEGETGSRGIHSQITPRPFQEVMWQIIQNLQDALSSLRNPTYAVRMGYGSFLLAWLNARGQLEGHFFFEGLLRNVSRKVVLEFLRRHIDHPNFIKFYLTLTLLNEGPPATYANYASVPKIVEEDVREASVQAALGTWDTLCCVVPLKNALKPGCHVCENRHISFCRDQVQVVPHVDNFLLYAGKTRIYARNKLLNDVLGGLAFSCGPGKLGRLNRERQLSTEVDILQLFFRLGGPPSEKWEEWEDTGGPLGEYLIMRQERLFEPVVLVFFGRYRFTIMDITRVKNLIAAAHRIFFDGRQETPIVNQDALAMQARQNGRNDVVLPSESSVFQGIAAGIVRGICLKTLGAGPGHRTYKVIVSVNEKTIGEGVNKTNSWIRQYMQRFRDNGVMVPTCVFMFLAVGVLNCDPSLTPLVENIFLVGQSPLPEQYYEREFDLTMFESVYDSMRAHVAKLQKLKEDVADVREEIQQNYNLVDVLQSLPETWAEFCKRIRVLRENPFFNPHHVVVDPANFLFPDEEEEVVVLQETEQNKDRFLEKGGEAIYDLLSIVTLETYLHRFDNNESMAALKHQLEIAQKEIQELKRQNALLRRGSSKQNPLTLSEDSGPSDSESSE